MWTDFDNSFTAALGEDYSQAQWQTPQKFKFGCQTPDTPKEVNGDKKQEYNEKICIHCGSVARYHGTTAAPQYRVSMVRHGMYMVCTSTVAFTVLFSTAIPQVPRFFGTVLVRC